MSYGTRAGFEALRSVEFGSIGAAYAAVGPALSDHGRIITITNATNQDVFISLNGTTDHMRLPSLNIRILLLTENKVRDDGFFLPIRTSFFVKHGGVAPASGFVGIEVVVATAGGV